MAEGNDILSKAEDAFSSHIISQALTINVYETTYTFDADRVYAGHSRGPKTADQPLNQNSTGEILIPRIQAIAVSAEPDEGFEFVGNWIVDFDVILTTSAFDTAESDHKSAFASLLNVILPNSICDSLTAAIDDYTCRQRMVGPQSFEAEDGHYVSLQKLFLYCSGKDFS